MSSNRKDVGGGGVRGAGGNPDPGIKITPKTSAQNSRKFLGRYFDGRSDMERHVSPVLGRVIIHTV